MAEVHINKLAAARRQLQAAIRMFFYGEDELAVHTVAAAAYRLIADLKNSRSRNEVEDYYRTMVFYNVRDYRRGTLPKSLTDNVEYMKHVREWAEALPSITDDSNYEDLEVILPPGEKKRFWSSQRRVSNFLKHADKDSEAHISLDEVKNDRLLMQASASYLDIAGSLGPEVEVLLLYTQLRDGENLDGAFQEVSRLPADEQRIFFHEYLTELRRESGKT